MKTLKLALILLTTVSTLAVSEEIPEKYVSTKTHIKFFSTTPVEDIEAHNYASVSTLVPATGEVVFSVPIQSFEFEKAMMQEHFNNEHFLESSVYPKSKFKGTITNLKPIEFGKNGRYETEVKGVFTIKDVSKPITATGTIEISDNSIIVNSIFTITLSDYGITFNESEMVSKKIAKTVEITVTGAYNPN